MRGVHAGDRVGAQLGPEVVANVRRVHDWGGCTGNSCVRRTRCDARCEPHPACRYPVIAFRKRQAARPISATPNDREHGDVRQPPTRCRRRRGSGSWSPSRAQEWGISRAIDCIAAGIICHGIMQPPRAPSARPAKTPSDEAWSAFLGQGADQHRGPGGDERRTAPMIDARGERVAPGHAERDRGDRDDVRGLQDRHEVAPQRLAGDDRPDRRGRGGHPPRDAQLLGVDEPPGGGHRGQEHEQDELRGRAEGELREAGEDARARRPA